MIDESFGKIDITNLEAIVDVVAFLSQRLYNSPYEYTNNQTKS